MNTMAQAWHIARKDVVHLRWWLVGYVLLTIVSTLTVTRLLDATWQGAAALLSPALWVAGIVIAALLVQSDAPANARAFWSSHPIHPFALLLSKLISVLLLLLLPPLLGQLAALRFHGVGGPDLGILVRDAAWVYGGALLLAMLIASLTRRFAGFVATSVGGPVLFIVAGITFSDTMYRDSTAWIPGALLQSIATGGAMALLTIVYRQRRAARPLVGAAAVVLAAGFLAISRAAARAERSPVAETAASGVEIEVGAIDGARLLRDREFFVSFTARGMRDGYRYALLTDSAKAVWADGTASPLWTPLFMTEVPNLFGGSGAESNTGTVVVMLPRTTAGPQPRGTITEFRVFGAVETVTSERVLQLASTAEAEHRDGDIRVKISGRAANGAGTSLAMTTVYRAGVDIRDVFALRRRYTAQLVWPNRADTVQVPLGGVSDEERMLVLPGASVHRVQLRESTDQRGSLDSLPLPRSDASLELLRWTPVARRNVVLTRSVP